MDQNAKVSVVVSTFQREAMLRRALESLAEQTFRNFEIVVVDDNGDREWNDRVRQVIGEFRQAHPELTVKYIQNRQNLGSAQARNRGIAASEGAYVTFLDDDDLYLPEKLERQLAYMEENGIDYCVTDMELYYENGSLSEKRVRKGVEKLQGDALLCYHFMYHLTGTDTMMFRKDYLQRIGGFPPIDVGDEFYLIHRAIEGGGKFGYMHRCDVKAYVHTGEGGLSSGQGKIDGENRLYEYKKGFFHRFSAPNIRYMRMRHYAVLAFAGLRGRAYGVFLSNGLVCFLAAPVRCVQLLLRRKSGGSGGGLEGMGLLEEPVV